MGLLDGLLGGGGARRGGPSPIALGIMALLAYKAFKGKNFSDMFGNANAPGGAGANPGAGGGGLGGFFGGGAAGGLAGGLGGILSGGLGDLLKQFQNAGHGDTADSWVSPGANKPCSTAQIAEALGEEKIAWLMQQTNLSREELLAGLCKEMPKVVDELTPEGRIPSPDEAHRIIEARSVN